jgi:hypothetical protein
MVRLTVSRHFGQCDTEMVKYQRYKSRIEGSVEGCWIQIQGSTLTTYDQQLIKEKDKVTFFSFMLVQREFLIPSNSKDLPWKEYEAASPHKDGQHIGIKAFPNWLVKLQTKLIDKDGNQPISKEVKRRKFLHHLTEYMETTLVAQILDS